MLKENLFCLNCICYIIAFVRLIIWWAYCYMFSMPNNFSVIKKEKRLLYPVNAFLFTVKIVLSGELKKSYHCCKMTMPMLTFLFIPVEVWFGCLRNGINSFWYKGLVCFLLSLILKSFLPFGVL